VFAVKVGLWGLLLIRPRTVCHQRTKCSLPFLFFSGARTEPTPLLWPSAFLKSTCGKETGGRKRTLRHAETGTRRRGDAETRGRLRLVKKFPATTLPLVAPWPRLPLSPPPCLRVSASPCPTSKFTSFEKT